MTIDDIIKEANEASNAKGWWDGFDELDEKGRTGSVAEKLLMMHSEVSEATEVLRTAARFKEETGTAIDEMWYMGESDICWDFESELYEDPDDDFKVTGRHLNKPEGFTAELADVIIRVCDLAGKINLPLARAVQEKLLYNKTREFRHGGKAL